MVTLMVLKLEMVMGLSLVKRLERQMLFVYRKVPHLFWVKTLLKKLCKRKWRNEQYLQQYRVWSSNPKQCIHS